MSSSDAASGGGGGGGEGAHILVIPFPAQGHLLPLLHLCHQLSLRGLTLTLLVTPRNLPLLSSFLSSHPAARTLVLPFPGHPSLPSGVENASQVGNTGVGPLIAALSSLADPIARWFSSHPSPPLAILSDFFLGWTVSLADELSVPRVAFFSSGPFFASVYDRLWRHHNSPTSRSLPVLSLPDLPRSPSFPRGHLPSTFLRYDGSHPDWEIVRAAMLANASSWGCAFNTFEAIEGEYLEHLKRERYGHGRIYGVGPLSLLTYPPRPGAAAADPNPEETRAAMEWLDECPEQGSVLYVCFGSQKLLKKAQMEALASGLERSGARFIWVVKPCTAEQLEGGYGSVPDGFEERVGRRGVVLRGWAPQVEILNHGAVGWFLSHCGWNSTLEALAAGVVILGWPMEAEQYVNARLLVEDLGVAARVWEGEDSVPDPAELAARITVSMRGEGAERAARRAREMRGEALRAVESGGSSTRDLDGLVGDLLAYCEVVNQKNRELE